MVGKDGGPSQAARARVQNASQAGLAGFGKQMAAWAKRAGVGEAVAAIGEKFSFKDMVRIGGRLRAQGAAPLEEGQGCGSKRVAVQKGVGIGMAKARIHGGFMAGSWTRRWGE